mmetsp:Transcript_75413/g.238379  ORF Transcript_75413/g.238379 Transcript_75413/m.238379 type:complete len:467 (-) Transcript_75413:245-1645(-)
MVAVVEHLLKAVEAAHAGTHRVPHLREVDVLVELVGVHDSTLPHGLGASHQREERHPVHLADDVLRDAKVPGVPVARHLRADPAVRAERPGNEDLGALAHAHRPRARSCLRDLAEVAVLPEELASYIAVVDLHWWEVLFEQDSVVHHGVVAVKALQDCGVQDAHAAAAQDPLFVELLDVPVAHWLAGGRVDPAAVVDRRARGSRLRPVEVLDEAQHPGQQDTTLDAELAVPLHLPAGPGVAPRAHLAEAGDHDGGGGVHHAPQLREGRPLLRGRRGRAAPRGVRGIRPRAHQPLLLRVPRGGDGAPALDQPVNLQVAPDELDLRGAGVQVRARAGGGAGQVVDALHLARQEGMDGPRLGHPRHVGVHQAHEAEGHLRGGEGVAAELLHGWGDDVVGHHEVCTAHPAHGGTDDGEVVLEPLGVPLLEKGLQPQLGLRVEPVIAKDAVVRGEGHYAERGPALDPALPL